MELFGSSKVNATPEDNTTTPDIHWDGDQPVCFQDGGSTKAVMNIPALVSVLLFYALMVGVGIWASWKLDKRRNAVDFMLAGRELGLFVGIVTLTATWVGGGYINGTAEKIFTPGYGNGVLWAQAPACASLGLILGGLLFARRMHEAGYVTMLDPFQAQYGGVTTALLFCMSCLSNIFYSAGVLSALGATLTVVTGLRYNTAVAVSTSISVCYTLFGGLASVAYTDILQLGCMVVGLDIIFGWDMGTFDCSQTTEYFGLSKYIHLTENHNKPLSLNMVPIGQIWPTSSWTTSWIAIPFALANPAVQALSVSAKLPSSWLGEVHGGIWPVYYMDTALAMIFGGIPWQDFFQRVLSQKTPRRAVLCSVVGGCGCIVVAIPAYIIGAIASSTDWNATEYRHHATIPVPSCDRKLALPLVLQFLTPLPVAVIGLGAVSAAVMSSADSSVLAPGSMFSYNIYRPIRALVSDHLGIAPASEKEHLWVMRMAILVVAVVAAIVAMLSDTIYGLWYLSHDLGYFVLFPQLLCLIYYKGCNVFGAVSGMVVGLILRLTAGDPLMNLPALVRYPFFDRQTGNQLFPYRTMSMLLTIITILSVSKLANHMMERKLFEVRIPVATENPDTEQSGDLEQFEIVENMSVKEK